MTIIKFTRDSIWSFSGISNLSGITNPFIDFCTNPIMVRFRDQLREYMRGEIPEKVIEILPSGFQAISDVVILNLDERLYDYKVEIGKAVMELLPRTKAVWLRKGIIKGKFRKPSGLEHLCGSEKTEVIHKENGIRYKFDFTKIMFAKGNITERAHLPTLVSDDETIVDMFAGIGYFSLGIGKHASPKKIYAMELNPVSYNYLEQNVRLNKLEDVIESFEGDCSEIVPNLAKTGIKADRIIMGVFPAPYKYVESALKVVKCLPLRVRTDLQSFVESSEETYKDNAYDKLKEPIENTVIHFEGVSMGKNITEMFGKFANIAEKSDFKTSPLAYRFVKSFCPKMWHLVLDIAVGT